MIEYIDPRIIYTDPPKSGLNENEKNVLRELAAKVQHYAQDHKQEEKKKLWYAHNSLQRIRPMVLVFPEGAWLEILPWDKMVCREEFYRAYEWAMRRLCYRFEHFDDDFVIEPVIEVPLVYEITPFIKGGASFIHMDMKDSGEGIHQNKILLEKEEDIRKLSKQEFIFYKEESERNLCLIREVIGDLIEVRSYGYMAPDTSLLRQFIEMRGTEQIFYDLYDQPEWLHEVLGFMRDSTLELLQVMEPCLMKTNTGNDYIGSGGIGYIHGPGSDRALYQNSWGFSDAQELAGVSPDMYEEFATAYHQPLLEKFGWSCYGCCEPMTDKFDIIKKRIKNLRRVSVNPWTDREAAAIALLDQYVYSWKPAPTVVTRRFDEEGAGRDIKRTMEIAGGCVVEMILKDTVTVQHEPERIERWIHTAKYIAEKGYA